LKTKIDKWFIEQIKEIIDIENVLIKHGFPKTANELNYVKSIGFTDGKISELTRKKIEDVKIEREKLRVFSVYKKIRSEFNMKFRPLHDRVLIESLDSEEKTAGGIIIPDTAKEKPQEGKVVAIGSGARTEDGKIVPMDVKVGDLVLFGKWSGTEVKIDGKEYSIMKESDIMGISKGKK